MNYKQFFGFALAGVGAIFVKIVVTAILLEIFGLGLELAYAISLGVIVLYGYIMNYSLIFQNKENPTTKLIIYICSILAISMLDWAFVSFGTNYVTYLIVIPISTALFFIVKYFLYSKFVFIDYNNVKGGNYYDKHNSKNPIIQFLMHEFYATGLAMVTEVQRNTLVDVGAGEGHFTSLVKHATKMEITAYELDDNTILEANKRYPDLNVQKGNILTITGHYDILLATEVLEHVPEYEKAIINCKSIADICIFSVPREPWFRIANICRLKYLPRLGNTPGHVNNWTKGQFKRLLESHFSQVEIVTCNLWTFARCTK